MKISTTEQRAFRLTLLDAVILVLTAREWRAHRQAHHTNASGPPTDVGERP